MLRQSNCGRRFGLLAGRVLLVLAGLPGVAAAQGDGGRSAASPGRSELQVARKVDAKIAEALQAEGITPAPRTTDEDFLRRVSLDLAGTIPTPREVTLFGLDPSPDKREQAIDRLLESDGYAGVWAAYWAEVVLANATEERARLRQEVFEGWLEEQFRTNRPWDEIVTELLTATGGVAENGATGLMFAHFGAPEELAAESSRIFLGVQIQCANCHDHPTDKWKREQFHQLAAFFPRVSVRRAEGAESPLEFQVMSVQPRARRAEPGQFLKRLDRDRDGKVTTAEAKAAPRQGEFFTRLMERGDADKDGALSLEEVMAMPAPDQKGRGATEHYMSDLNDPTARGTLMQPVFFLTNAKLPEGAEDLDRRGTLAHWMTAKSNPWFRKAFVNRMWTELLGEGFYTPVDDMGPERTADFEEVLEILANGFSAHGYDVRWLLRTITLTEAYQRQLRIDADGLPPTGAARFAGAAPTRLRSDQLYSVLTQVLGVERVSDPGAGGRRGSPRRTFHDLFGYDPSMPQADVQGNIPQALFMMNSNMLDRLTNAQGDTVLGRILRAHPDDDDALDELYLRTLVRSPTDRERELFHEYRKQFSTRGDAFEDLQWALLNSTEFLTKR